MSNQDVIAALEQAFPQGVVRQREGAAGRMLDYIDWPVAVRRLNEAVGADNWDFEVSDLQFRGDATSGYVICKGRLTIRFSDGTSSSKEQYGGNHYGQLQTGRQGLNPDDAAKAAGSDAIKKCAALFGVALDLSEKAPQTSVGQQNGYAPRQQNTPATHAGGPVSLECADCGSEVTGGNFKDGKPFTAQQAAGWGQRKYGRSLCSPCYQAGGTAARRADDLVESLPF